MMTMGCKYLVVVFCFLHLYISEILNTYITIQLFLIVSLKINNGPRYFQMDKYEFRFELYMLAISFIYTLNKIF